MGDFIGYARVSTAEQDLEVQHEKLREAGCKRIFGGKHSGRADTNKDALAELLSYVRDGDTVVVTKLDRLGRSLSQVLNALDELTSMGVRFKALDQNIDTANNDPMSKAMVQLLGMFAEMERNFIVSRTTEGKRASGNYGGRPSKLSEEQREEIKKALKEGVPKTMLSKDYGVSRGTIRNIELAELS